MADIREYKRLKEQKSNVVSGRSRFNVQPLPEAHNDRKSDFREAEDTDDAWGEDNYEAKLRKHRLKNLAVMIVAAVLVVCAVFYVVNGVRNRVYTSYTITASVTKDNVQDARYAAFGDGYVRYSNDGIAYFDRKGNAIWNQTYQMKSPSISVRGDCLAVGDINGSTIYMFNKKGMLGSVDTSLSISQVEMGESNLVAAILEDSNANYINLYDESGSKVYSVKTTLAGDGYPLGISISQDATKLIASYVYVNGDSIKTNVVFYNFSDVGQNETERVVGGFDYDSTLVPEVHFLTDTCAVAIGEDVIGIYRIKEFPSLYKSVQVDAKIDRVFTSSKYIGLVVDNQESGYNYKLLVYDINGNLVSQTTFNTLYDTIKFDGDTILMYNDSLVTLMNCKGKVLFEQKMDLPVEDVLSAGVKGRYFLVNSTYVQEIYLK